MFGDDVWICAHERLAPYWFIPQSLPASREAQI